MNITSKSQRYNWLLRAGAVTAGAMALFWFSEFLSGTNLLGPNMLLASIVSALIGGVSLFLIVHAYYQHHLQCLAKTASDIASGEVDVIDCDHGPSGVRALGNSISSLVNGMKENIDSVYQLAYVDKTTQLPNREFFRKELTRCIRRVERQKSVGALLFVDLDGFKRVNDTHGHDAGDQILQEFSNRLATVLRAEDLVGFKSNEQLANEVDLAHDDEAEQRKSKQMLARLGGDEFTVLLSEIREPTDAATVSKRIIDAVSEPFVVSGISVSIGASVGISIFPQDGNDYDTILKCADMAMYQSKEEGKNTYRYYSQRLNEEAIRRMEIEVALREALESCDELELHYQPKIDCRTGVPTSVEALVRWNHPIRGQVQPLEFIGVAEDCGLILPLGLWVLEGACRQIVEFEKAGLDLSVSVNVSTAQFERADLADCVVDALNKTNADPTKLELELTESMAMQNPDMVLLHMSALKKHGVRFSIDDFGTGYSNLYQLSNLPFDMFKIDGSFVDKLSNRDDHHGRTIVKTVLAMANSLNYKTVAEGVETVGQLEFLSEYGCDAAQGYYFSKPLPREEIMAWIKDWNSRDRGDIANRLRQGTAA